MWKREAESSMARTMTRRARRLRKSHRATMRIVAEIRVTVSVWRPVVLAIRSRNPIEREDILVRGDSVGRSLGFDDPETEGGREGSMSRRRRDDDASFGAHAVPASE